MHANATTRLLVSGAAALALSAWACTNTNSDRTTATATGTSGAANEQAVTLTGCVQQTSGITGDYILTEVNSQNRPIGTSGAPPSGTSGSADTAAKEQRQAAVQSYRLDGDNAQLKELVGKQVNVMGHIAAQGNIGGAGAPGGTGTSGSATPDINASDLARVKIDSITKVADSCGDQSPR